MCATVDAAHKVPQDTHPLIPRDGSSWFAPEMKPIHLATWLCAFRYTRQYVDIGNVLIASIETPQKALVPR